MRRERRVAQDCSFYCNHDHMLCTRHVVGYAQIAIAIRDKGVVLLRAVLAVGGVC